MNYFKDVLNLTISSNIIKSTAITHLKGNWTRACFSALILVFSILVVLYSSSFLNVIGGNFLVLFFKYSAYVTVILPLFLGLFRFFWRMISNCEDNPISVFYYFSDLKLYLKTLKFALRLFIKFLPVIIIVLIPNLIIYLFSTEIIFNLFDLPIPLWSRNLELPILFFQAFAKVILAFYGLKFYISPFIFVANSDIEVEEIIYASSVISKKTSLDFIFLFLSFIGWIIISFFAIPVIFTLPYMITAYVVHTNIVVNEYNNHLKEINSNDYPTFSVGV